MNCPFKSVVFYVGIEPVGPLLFYGTLLGNILYLWECLGFCSHVTEDAVPVGYDAALRLFPFVCSCFQVLNYLTDFDETWY